MAQQTWNNNENIPEVLGEDGKIDQNFDELYAKDETLTSSIAVLNAGSGCPVSADDTTPGYLSNKLTAGTGVKHEILSPGGDESLQISILSNTAQSVTAVASLSIDLSLGHVIILDHAVNITSLAFTNVPTACEVIIYRDGGTAAGLEWGDISFLPNAEPILNSKTKSVIRLFTADGGTTFTSFVQNIQQYNGFAVAHNVSPYVSIYDSAGVKITDPDDLPTGEGYDVAISPDGAYLAVAHSTSPFVTIYDTSDWSKIANPSTLPTGPVFAVAFSPDSSLLAVGENASPYILVYNTSDWSLVTEPSSLPPGSIRDLSFSHDGSFLACVTTASPYVVVYDTSDWTKETQPSTLPVGAAYGVTYNHDSSLLVVAHTTTPFITIYDTSDMSKIDDPDGLPTGTGRGVAFNIDGSILAVGHSITPFFTSYTVSDWSKRANLDPLPTNDVNRVAFNDENVLAIVSNDLPYLALYNADMSSITAPETMPTGAGRAVAFSSIPLED